MESEQTYWNNSKEKTAENDNFFEPTPSRKDQNGVMIIPFSKK